MSAAGSTTDGHARTAGHHPAQDRRSFRAALSRLESAQKPGPGVPAYTRWLNRRLARFVAASAYCLRLSPNTVTIISAVLSFGAFALMVTVRPTPALGIPVALLLVLGYVLDSADGQVARLTGRSSPAGEWLDHVVDAVRTPAVHASVLVGFATVAGIRGWPQAIAIAYLLVTVGQFMSQILSEQLVGATRPETRRGGILQSVVLIPTDMGALCWIFIVWGFPGVFIWVYTVMFALNLLHTAVSMRRKYRKLAAGAQTG